MNEALKRLDSVKFKRTITKIARYIYCIRCRGKIKYKSLIVSEKIYKLETIGICAVKSQNHNVLYDNCDNTFQCI